MKLQLTFTLAVCFAIAATLAMPRSKLNDVSLPAGWQAVSRAPPSSRVSFSVLLPFNNADVLDATFEKVSDPSSPQYRKFLTQEQIHAMVAPATAHFERVGTWMEHVALHEFCSQRFDGFECNAPVAHVEAAFEAKLFSVRHNSWATSKVVIRHQGALSVPAAIAESVALVHGLSEYVAKTKFKARSFGPKTAYKGTGDQKNGYRQPVDVPITPDKLRSMYNIPDALYEIPVGKAKQGIAAFGDLYSESGMYAFKSLFEEPNQFLAYVGNGINVTTPTDELESDLDAQYITSTGHGLTTEFWETPEKWVLQWLLSLTSSLTDAPRVFSVSYGFPEAYQCLIGQCSSGESGSEYIARADKYMQMAAVNGISIMVSSGDQGAANQLNGYCPTDSAGVGYECELDSCDCASFIVSDATAAFVLPNVDLNVFDKIAAFDLFSGVSGYCNDPANQQACDCALSAEPTSCASQWMTYNTDCGRALTQFQGMWNVGSNAGNCSGYYKPTEAGVNAFGTNCSCAAVPTLSVGACSIKGFTMEALPPQYNENIFSASWPGDSPYVTSVGATQLPLLDYPYKPNPQEIVCSIQTQAKITSGGGFSASQKALAYQQSAVLKYLVQMQPGRDPPKQVYNAGNRAYPDVAANGHNYVIVAHDNLNLADNRNGSPNARTVDGTSASSPAFAGMVALLNNYLLSMGKDPLGFLNPLLYKMAQEQPETFNDIVEGDIKCTEVSCCSYGWRAAPGWDPATGLGTPNVAEILKYINTL